MKGLSNEAIIGLIIAIIVGLVLLYIAWTRGWLQFLFPVDEATCKTQLLKACDEYERRTDSKDTSMFKAISDQCGKFIEIPTETVTRCKDRSTNDCDLICGAVRSKWPVM